MKGMVDRVFMVGFLACLLAAGSADRAGAMKALSSADMAGVAGQQGISIYFTDLDARLLNLDTMEMDFSISDTTDCTFIVTDDGNAASMPIGDDDDSGGAHAMAFCGSPTDENVPIDVDWLGFDLDVSSDDATPCAGLNQYATTLSLVGYGSTEMYYVMDVAQFKRPGSAANDVFGLSLGEIFWAEEYLGPPIEQKQFMHIYMSALSAFADSAFVDSNEGAWRGSQSKTAIRSWSGIGGELGMKPGGGTFGFSGFNKSSGSPQRSTFSNVMFAGKILNRGTSADPYPSWKTQTATDAYYYPDDISDWYIMGEAVFGVHHDRTYTRSGYNTTDAVGGQTSNYGTDLDDVATAQIGNVSATRPIRIEVATADAGYDCNADGLRDNYLVIYLFGHYQRTVYHPDSQASSMGPSTTPVYTYPKLKNYIVGDLRIGIGEEKTPDMDGNGTNESVTHAGSWVVNDISLEYCKIVIPGDRNMIQEISAGSEDFLIPDVDFGDGTNAAVQLPNFGDPTSSERTMYRTNPTLGTSGDWANPPANPADLALPPAWWR